MNLPQIKLDRPSSSPDMKFLLEDYLNAPHLGSAYLPYMQLIGNIDQNFYQIAKQLKIELEPDRLLINRDLLLYVGTEKPGGWAENDPAVGLLVVGYNKRGVYPVRHVIHKQTEVDQLAGVLAADEFAKVDVSIEYPGFCDRYKTYALRCIYAPIQADDNAFREVVNQRWQRLVLAAARSLLETEVEIMKEDAAKDIFLSHSSVDKELVREIAISLRELGFSPWLDEDRMPAGTPLERGLRSGLSSSCAAVFFITPNFRDNKYISSEIDYALEEKTTKGEKFAIITLLMRGATSDMVPEILRRYVYKEATDLTAVREIVRSLPIRADRIVWR